MKPWFLLSVVIFFKIRLPLNCASLLIVSCVIFHVSNLKAFLKSAIGTSILGSSCVSCVASLANLFAISLPLMPTCTGIYMLIILLSNSLFSLK